LRGECRGPTGRDAVGDRQKGSLKSVLKSYFSELGPVSSSSDAESEPSHGSDSTGRLLPDPVKDGAGCRYPEVNLQGGDLQPQDGGHGIETADPDHCRDECGKRKKCQFWSFVKEWKVNCYLKERKGPEREMDGATSGSIFIACGQ
jgi:hypothetical protein